MPENEKTKFLEAIETSNQSFVKQLQLSYLLKLDLAEADLQEIALQAIAHVPYSSGNLFLSERRYTT